MKVLRFTSLIASLLLASALTLGCDEPSLENQPPVTNPDNTDPDNTDPGNTDPGNTESPVNADTVTTESCDQYTVESCDGTIARFCNEDAKITLRDCAKLSTPENPLVCKKLAGENFVDCVAPCTKTNYTPYNVCAGNYVESRDCYDVEGGGSYEFGFTDDPCSKYCSDGKCVDTPEPEVGATCGADFAPTCYGGNGFDCVNGSIVKTTCTSGTVCAMQSGDKHTQCVEKCVGQDDIYACTMKDGKPALDNHVCRVATDAKTYYFHETTVCNNTCNNGVCDVTIPQVGEGCNPADFDDICAHNTVYYCHTTTHKVVSATCGKGDYMGQQLCRDITDTYSDCVAPCSEGDEGLMQCVKGGDFNYTDNLVCTQALDGAYYYVNEQEQCSGECKNGVCL